MGSISLLWCQSFEQNLSKRERKRGRSHPLSPAHSACLIGRSYYRPCGFFWSQLWTLAYVSKGWENWWLMGTSFTELRDVYFALWHYFYGMILDIKSKHRVWRVHRFKEAVIPSFLFLYHVNFWWWWEKRKLPLYLIHNTTLTCVCWVNHCVSL